MKLNWRVRFVYEEIRSDRPYQTLASNPGAIVLIVRRCAIALFQLPFPIPKASWYVQDDSRQMPPPVVDGVSGPT